ncbi:MAG TPA: alpha/beta hydrolase [Burkholderiales bacterium]|nr:alpha/beta hydrolase [Burkholderiales bacterium]
MDLYARAWPYAHPRAAIALLHGQTEHSGRYDALARRFNSADIAVYAIDLRGHGRSPGRRAWIEHFDEYLLDAQALLGYARASVNAAAVPLFLMGHGMGGTIAALYALERLPFTHEPVTGLILSSATLVAGHDAPRWRITLDRLVGRYLPWLPVRKIDPALLSRDAVAVATNRNDPLVHHGAIPARTGEEILAATRRITAQCASLSLPTLVYHGSADRLAGPEGSREFAAHAGGHPTLQIYEGNFHETINDLDRERVTSTLIAWTLAQESAPPNVDVTATIG